MEKHNNADEGNDINIESNPEKFETNFIESSISKNHIGSGKLLESRDFPDKIIRKEKVSTILLKHGQNGEPAQLMEQANVLFKELEHRYGISVPLENMWIDDDNQAIYSVVKHILKSEENPEEIAEKENKLYTCISKYFLDKYIEGGPFLWDINGQSQYVYGVRPGDHEANFHLIDTDIWMNNDREQLPFVVYWMTRHMGGVERKSGFVFSEARNNIKNFVDAAIVDYPGLGNDENIKAINDFLNNIYSSYNPKSAIPKYKI